MKTLSTEVKFSLESKIIIAVKFHCSQHTFHWSENTVHHNQIFTGVNTLFTAVETHSIAVKTLSTEMEFFTTVKKLSTRWNFSVVKGFIVSSLWFGIILFKLDTYFLWLSHFKFFLKGSHTTLSVGILCRYVYLGKGSFFKTLLSHLMRLCFDYYLICNRSWLWLKQGGGIPCMLGFNFISIQV